MYKTVILNQQDYNLLSLFAQQSSLSKSQMVGKLLSDYVTTKQQNKASDTKSFHQQMAQMTQQTPLKKKIKIDYQNFDTMFEGIKEI